MARGATSDFSSKRKSCKTYTIRPASAARLIQVRKAGIGRPALRSSGMQSQSNSRYKLYTAMSSSCQDKISLRHELVRHALSKGIRACARQFGCSRNTVRVWLRRADASNF
jgi:hypothetical protein